MGRHTLNTESLDATRRHFAVRPVSCFLSPLMDFCSAEIQAWVEAINEVITAAAVTGQQ